MITTYRSFFASLLVCSTALAPIAYAGSKATIDTVEEAENPWTYEFGVAFMTENTIGQILTGTVNFDDTDSGAEIYQFTATRLLSTLPVTIGGRTYHPQLEMPLCLEVVDENSQIGRAHV